ncbi:MAG: hypothetical protein WKF33_05270 [Thermoleophilaceae bacterium]
MAKIVIHAGMPKAGSSSVSAWLERHAADLWSDSGIRLCVAQTQDAVVGVRPYVRGSPNSASLLLAADAAKEHHGGVIEVFAASLDERAESDGVVVLSSEAFAPFFWRPDTAYLAALQELTCRHEVHVAYYVRPQNTSVEAAWRQWGFRYGVSPSAYIASQEAHLRYVETYRTVRRLAPDVRFLPRPFRRDLLDGNVATDFDRHFLRGAVAPVAPDPSWENQGLALDVVTALRGAPKGLLWDSPHDNRALRRVKKLSERLDADESEEVRRSRRILERYCHDLYEAGNRELIAELGWDTDAFTQGVGQAGESGDLSALDELWTSRASPLEQALLHSALGEVVTDSRLPSAPAGSPDGSLAAATVPRRHRLQRALRIRKP